jgi:hypothetical protein
MAFKLSYLGTEYELRCDDGIFEYFWNDEKEIGIKRFNEDNGDITISPWSGE